jgi:hypothetical protein
MRRDFRRTQDHRYPIVLVIEQRRLLGRADQLARQRPRLEAALLIQLARMCNRLTRRPTRTLRTGRQ